MSFSLPYGCIFHIWVPRRHHADQRSQRGVLLHLQQGPFGRQEDGRLVHVGHGDAHDGLVAEGAQVGEARVHVLVHRLHHHVVAPLALKVQWLLDVSIIRLTDAFDVSFRQESRRQRFSVL